MSPADLRLVLTALPWPSYTHGELNEIYGVMMSALTTTRNCQRIHQEREKLQAMAQRPRLTDEQILAATTKSQVYPAGSRFD